MKSEFKWYPWEISTGFNQLDLTKKRWKENVIRWHENIFSSVDHEEKEAARRLKFEIFGSPISGEWKRFFNHFRLKGRLFFLLANSFSQFVTQKSPICCTFWGFYQLEFWYRRSIVFFEIFQNLNLNAIILFPFDLECKTQFSKQLKLFPLCYLFWSSLTFNKKFPFIEFLGRHLFFNPQSLSSVAPKKFVPRRTAPLSFLGFSSDSKHYFSPDKCWVSFSPHWEGEQGTIRRRNLLLSPNKTEKEYSPLE